MKKLLFLILILSLASCKKSNDTYLKDKDIVDISMKISFIDVNGADLLNQNNPNAFNISYIKLYHQVNGEELYFEPHLTTSKELNFSCKKSFCSIRILLADTTFLQLNNQITDTIYSEIANFGLPIASVKKIWYNGEFIWDAEDGVEKYFTILK